MIRIIIMLSLLTAVFCQYQRQRASPTQSNPAPQNYEQPDYDEDDYDYRPQPNDYRPQPKNNVVYMPAPVHYVNIGAELAGDYKFGYDTGKAENGQSFREETRLPDGTVQGAYGYVGETGKQRIVKYTAGKDGFKVIGTDEEKKSSPQPKASAPKRAYSQPQVHQSTYRPQPQAQKAHGPSQQVSRAQPVEHYQSSQNTYRASPEPQRAYVPASQGAYVAEPQTYAAEPQSAYAPDPQRAAYAPHAQRAAYAPHAQRAAYAPHAQRAAYAPQPQRAAYVPQPQTHAQAHSSRSQTRGRAGSRYVPEPTSYSQDAEEDYDYPDNDITERRLAPIDTSLLNYNIGTSTRSHV